VFLVGSTINLGDSNMLSNIGVFSMGGADAIVPTALKGNFTQTTNGISKRSWDRASHMIPSRMTVRPS